MNCEKEKRGIRTATRKKISSAVVLILAGVGGSFLFLNFLTPMVADDFFYACRLGYATDGALVPIHRLQEIRGIVLSQKCVYIAHSGRIPVLATVQIFTLLPNCVFDLCNTLVFLLLLWLLVQLAMPHSRQQLVLPMLGAALLFWQCTPAFGQNFLWQTGAINYLWTMTATLAFLLFCLHPLPSWQGCPFGNNGCFLLGLLSGWSMENQAAAACCLSLSCLVLRWRQEGHPP